MSRYDKRDEFRVDFSKINEHEKPAKKKTDWVEEMLKIGGAAAPMVGTGIGALVGGGLPGAAIGGAIGAGAGGLMNYGATALGADEIAAEEERLAREEERQARTLAAQRFLGG